MIELITGPMGSGKSEALLTKLKMKMETKIPIVCFKPKTDTRTKGEIRSRNGMFHKAFEVENFLEMVDMMIDYYQAGVTHFIIDEVQFMKHEGFEKFVIFTQTTNVSVYAAGLNQTSEMTAFKETAVFAMFADSIVVLQGKCAYCGGNSKRTVCTIPKDGEVLIGDDVYEQTCYACGEALRRKK